jgi:hypothetical protein
MYGDEASLMVYARQLVTGLATDPFHCSSGSC